MVERVFELFNSIFKKGSKTYYYSSIFFPQKIKEDVFVLYAFVRTADDFVDKIPQDSKGIRSFIKDFNQCWKYGSSKFEIIELFVKLSKRKNFNKAWVDAFLNTMESDCGKQEFKSIKEAEKYMYGSAEVIGLMMAAILDLPEAAYPGARLLGKSMQYINFIRDIDEDFSLGRSYLPQEINSIYGLKHLTPDMAIKKPEATINAIRHHLTIYRKWLDQTNPYFSLIPKRSRIAIQTASDMYEYTAKVIEKDPLIVFKTKVKPTKSRIIFSGIINSLS